ncbi:hypothetical protein [Streptomyces beihaiensis]|uniref:Uncharacterized protein n=1 Tax=Streptomyces beihaiensis TaxID=2984495 RepID=A0ABT3TZA7_9ACTN|nr:hypothetical protein [Streptomyces beihaiensis]MCX3062389.1 hypothetical protein [Streptomyces beihaiensis]
MDTEKVTPVTGAGFDPAYVPGLTPPVASSADEETSEEVKQTESESEAEPEPESRGEADAAEEAESEDAKDAEKSDDAKDSEDAEKSDDAKDSEDAPAVEARDRRGSIVVDASGVRFTLDDQEAEFTWDEISAVEVGTSRKRLTVTVHTPNSRWYPNDVEARDKAQAQEWAEAIDKALDAYFED